MKTKNKSENTLTLISPKVTQEVLEIEPTHYISNNVDDENYDGAFALIYNQAFKKCFEPIKNIIFISEEGDINLDWKTGQIFHHQAFEYSIEENWDSYFISSQKAEGVTSNSLNIFYIKLFKESITKGNIIYIKEPEIELCWGYSEELDTHNIIFNWNIKFMTKELINETSRS